MEYQLSDIPEFIEISDKSFVLAGAIVFVPPLMVNDIGHYLCASKINNTWEFYDDMDRSSPRKKSSNSHVAIHSLMYVIAE